jgi:hypothetical protein
MPRPLRAKPLPPPGISAQANTSSLRTLSPLESWTPRTRPVWQPQVAGWLNDVDPQAWRTDILTRLQDHPAKRTGRVRRHHCGRVAPRVSRQTMDHANECGTPRRLGGGRQPRTVTQAAGLESSQYRRRLTQRGVIRLEVHVHKDDDDRLLEGRSESIAASKVDNVKCRNAAIFFSDSQNASSTLTLVLCPSITTERFTTRDFMIPPMLTA